jgi:hypothetical protein
MNRTLHETATPPLYYPVRIIEHKEVFTRTSYLSFHISKEDKEPPRLLLVCLLHHHYLLYIKSRHIMCVIYHFIRYALNVSLSIIADNEKEKTIMFLMYKDNPAGESKAIRLGFFNLKDKTECQNLIQVKLYIHIMSSTIPC